MEITSQILIAIIAFEHLYFLWLEMFGWESKGKKVFKGVMEVNLFEPTRGLAANQGLYNGFLAAGLIWTFFIRDSIWATNIAIFFLCCVIVAGIFGAMTIFKKLFFIQTIPAIIALVFALLQ